MSEEVAPVQDNATPSTEGGEAPKFGDFLQYAPEDYKDAGTWEKFKDADMGTALKAIVDMDRYVGKKGDIPGEDAGEEARAEFAKKLGFEVGEEPQTYIELGAEEFGDDASGLADMYNNGIHDAMGRIAQAFAQNPTMEGVAQGLREWAMNDAQATKAGQLESQQAMEQQAAEVASKLGLTPDAMSQMNQEVMKARGWDNNTTIHEVLNTFARETTNTNTMKQALNSTPAGKQARMDEIMNHPDFFGGGPEYQKLVGEYNKLFDELNKGS